LFACLLLEYAFDIVKIKLYFLAAITVGYD
jgi:hypothetical protein